MNRKEKITTHCLLVLKQRILLYENTRVSKTPRPDHTEDESQGTPGQFYSRPDERRDL